MFFVSSSFYTFFYIFKTIIVAFPLHFHLSEPLQFMSSCSSNVITCIYTYIHMFVYVCNKYNLISLHKVCIFFQTWIFGIKWLFSVLFSGENYFSNSLYFLDVCRFLCRVETEYSFLVPLYHVYLCCLCSCHVYVVTHFCINFYCFHSVFILSHIFSLFKDSFKISLRIN